jgi:photosystem II stability/assembly factor-like uncharacterized protein
MPTAYAVTRASLPPFSPKYFTNIKMINERDGWATISSQNGYYDVARTIDGGHTWKIVTPDQQFSNQDVDWTTLYLEAFFLDQSEAWVIYSGRNRPVWRTVDGGEHWVPSKQVFAGERQTIDFVNKSVGWLMVTNGPTTQGQVATDLHQTEDGGETWEQRVSYLDRNNQMNDPTAMIFADSTYGWVTQSHFNGIESSLLVTRNGGITWEDLKIPAPTQQPHLFDPDQKACWRFGLFSPMLFSDQVGALVLSCDGIYGGVDPTTLPDYLYKTTDGGKSWVTSKSPGRYLIYTSPQSIWAKATQRDGIQIYHSNDGGKTWSAIPGTIWTWVFTMTNDRLGYGVVNRTGNNATPTPEDFDLVRTTNGWQTREKIVPQIIP